MSTRPVHPMEAASTVQGLETYLPDGVMVMKATVQPDTTMRPHATDYQEPYQSTTPHGYDNDTPTKEWQPDADRVAPKEQQAPVPKAEPFPAVDVRIMPHGLVRTSFRTVIGTQEVYPVGPQYLGVVYVPTIRQLLSRDLNRQRAVIRPMSSVIPGVGLVTNTQPIYAFAISADKYFSDYMLMGAATSANLDGITFEVDGTDEMWCAIVPLLSYDFTKYNTYSLGVMYESVVTPDGPVSTAPVK